jgi:uncharacterized integral membrane protein
MSEPSAPARSDRKRQIAIAILSGVAILFAVLNFEDVEVDLLFGSVTMPLVIVIAFCLLLGGSIGAFLTRRRR